MGPCVLPPPPSAPPSPTLLAGLPTRAADLGSLTHTNKKETATGRANPSTRRFVPQAMQKKPADQPTATVRSLSLELMKAISR